LLVGDNRQTPNWGGRAAGIALVDLLGEAFDIRETVEGREFRLESAGYGLVGTLMPARFDHLLLHMWLNRAAHKPFDWVARIEAAAGARDFVSEDPQQTVDDIERYRGRIPELDALWRRVHQSDVVVVNGEGDFVFTTPARREVSFMLAMMALANKAGKPTYFLNAMLSDCPRTGRNATTLQHMHAALRRCAGVLVRDPESLAYITETMPTVPARMVPDALFAWQARADELSRNVPANGDVILPHPVRRHSIGRLDFGRPYILVGGTAAAAGERERAVESYCHLVAALTRLNLPVYLTQNDGPDGFLEEVAERVDVGFIPVQTPIFAAAGILAKARLFISGRYHPAIMASLGGTPSVFLGSTAHKMASLQRLLEYENPRMFDAFPQSAAISEIVDLSASYLAAGDLLRRRVQDAARRRAAETARLPHLLTARTSSSPQSGQRDLQMEHV
jgi:polysaccharide pyruvyl transferase WcaK-like protein